MEEFSERYGTVFTIKDDHLSIEDAHFGFSLDNVPRLDGVEWKDHRLYVAQSRGFENGFFSTVFLMAPYDNSFFSDYQYLFRLDILSQEYESRRSLPYNIVGEKGYYDFDCPFRGWGPEEWIRYCTVNETENVDAEYVDLRQFGEEANSIDDSQEAVALRNEERVYDISLLAMAFWIYTLDTGAILLGEEGECLSKRGFVYSVIADYINPFPFNDVGTEEVFCDNAYFYQSYLNDNAYVLVADMERGMELDQENLYCNVTPSVLDEVDSLALLKLVLSDEHYECTGEEGEAPVIIQPYSAS
ncbi:MAG: hypothetical protein UW70_C0013G0005 [Candidatus Peregrinibacteria bacterium GW2011_GWA2_44_7]|nr:MAG: hypothetical protein UW70_C0013G0005 [Candidatus Peregrinibacteria bacterium GW2011_GWA2_44_7]